MSEEKNVEYWIKLEVNDELDIMEKRLLYAQIYKVLESFCVKPRRVKIGGKRDF